MQLQETAVRLQVRIGLLQREDLAEVAADTGFDVSLARRRTQLGRLAAQRGDVVQRRLLVGRVLPDRVDQFRNQVVAAPELDLDIAPARERALAIAHQAVVDDDAVAQQGQQRRRQQPLDHGCYFFLLLALRGALSAASNASRAHSTAASRSSKKASGAR